jgi:radical SAM superfamily enzyme YgiQ (UPF0313 family)
LIVFRILLFAAKILESCFFILEFLRFDNVFRSSSRQFSFILNTIEYKIGEQFYAIFCSPLSDAADHYKKYFEHHVDYVVKGEGEETLKELIATLESGGDPSTIQGLVYKRISGAIVTAARPVLRNLDALPVPAWDLVDIEAYRSIWLKHHGYFSLNLATTRGCPFKRNWCAKPIYGNRYTFLDE